MIKIKWIKVGDVIEVDGKKAKLKSKVEDLTYTDLYTFKREDGSKFHWRHENIYRYVMDRHIRKLENLLSDEKQRADELERRWNELKDYLLRFENIPVQVQSFKTVFELMKEIERIEEENDEWKLFTHIATGM